MFITYIYIYTVYKYLKSKPPSRKKERKYLKHDDLIMFLKNMIFLMKNKFRSLLPKENILLGLESPSGSA